MLRKEMLFAVIGGVVGAVLAMAAAQSAPHVGRITCTDLEVVDSKGNPRVRLSADEYGGRVHVLGDGVSAAMLTRRHIAIVSVSDNVNDVNDDYLKTSMGIVGSEEVEVAVSGGGLPSLPRSHVDEDGRRVVVYPKDDKPEAKMGISKLGGYVRVSGGGEGYRSRAAMYITPNGGTISAQDKNGNPLRLADLK